MNDALTQIQQALLCSLEAGDRIHLSLGSGGLYGQPSIPVFIGIRLWKSVVGIKPAGDRPGIATSGDGLTALLVQDCAAQEVKLQFPYRVAPSASLSGLTPFSYTVGALPFIFDKQVADNFFWGHFGAEIGLLVEAGERSGATTVVGTDNLTAQSIQYVASPAPLIGEELYLLGARLRPGPWEKVSLDLHTLLRWTIILAILFGLLLKLSGIL
ncbi:MAG: hypothetical protein MUE67_08095 [Anaerolineales bacterium]|jgi:hypothetical protein|nr:hypothetical protein [Anaerolineales bacterium]